MRSRILHILCLGLMLGTAGCVNAPQTKALITPVGAIGYHTFAPPQQRAPTPSEIDRMVASIRKAGDQSAN